MISCASCRYFIPDQIGAGGVGQCNVEGEGLNHLVYESKVFDTWKKNPKIKGGLWRGLALWPHALRICGDYESKS